MTLIRNVSDTARWVAVYRARESERKDALFRDPLAARLAGERGRAIAASTPLMANGWTIIARTKLIDDLILASIAEGCDRVLNLAAGLDTRPYRLDLPPDLTWIEADLPALMREKDGLLAGDLPRCQIWRESVDLTDSAACARFLERATAGARCVLVVTEGLVEYLDEAEVQGLSRALLGRGVHFWIVDFTSPAIRDWINASRRDLFHNAPFKFAPAEGVAFFERLGWTARDVRSIAREAARLGRAPWFMLPFRFFPDANPRALQRARWAGVLRLERG